jgi:glycosyltransferase involved in cell wall biosynthesis
MVVPLRDHPHMAAGVTAVVTALVSGRPVIVTDTAASRDYVTHGVNGLLVPPEDPRALADAITRLDTDAALLSRLSDGARRTAGTFGIAPWARSLLHGSRMHDADHWTWTKWRGRPEERR